MARLVRQTEERIATIRSAWKELAATASFAGMTLEEFSLNTENALQIRAEIESLERQLEGRKVDRAVADEAAGDLMELVVNSVKGTPSYGPDSPLYRAMGYVRKSERRSGLTRKGLVLKAQLAAAMAADQATLGATAAALGDRGSSGAGSGGGSSGNSPVNVA
jgi:hypothetical protein